MKYGAAMLPFALIVVSGLIAQAWIVASVSGWSLAWSACPFAFACAAFQHVVTLSKPDVRSDRTVRLDD